MIEKYTGISIDIWLIGVASICLILLILYIINITKYSKLKKKFSVFMTGKDAQSLEETLVMRLEQIDNLIISNNKNERNIDTINEKMLLSINRYGLVRYDALDGMGGKLSFALAMLDEKENGFIINSVHSRDGSYVYIKEVINANTVANLSNEEKTALEKAITREDR